MSPVGETLEYIAGLYYQENNLTYVDKINVPPDSVLRAINVAFANIDTRRSFAQDSDMLSVAATRLRTRKRYGCRYTMQVESRCHLRTRPE